jgi:thiamine-phosphate diphosphorylase
MFSDYPILCMVTAGALTPASGPDAIAAWLVRVGAAIQAGVTLVQIREPRLEARALCDLTAAAVRAASGTRTRIVVNDRLDAAIAAGAHGMHLKEQSVPAVRVRAIAPPPFIVGQSSHDPAAAVEGVDYLIFGTVFPTLSKPGVDVGVRALQAAVSRATVPVLAIGGVNEERLPAVRAAGAAGFAAIGFFHDVEVPALAERCARARRVFDMPPDVS